MWPHLVHFLATRRVSLIFPFTVCLWSQAKIWSRNVSLEKPRRWKKLYLAPHYCCLLIQDWALSKRMQCFVYTISLQYFSRTRELRTVVCALVMWDSVELSIYDTSSTFMGGTHRMLRVRAHPFIALVWFSLIANDGVNFSLIWSPFLLEVSTEITCPYFVCWSSAFPVRSVKGAWCNR